MNAEELCLTREAVRELDRRAIEDYGIPSIVLMENAGRACVDVVLAMPEVPLVGAAPVLVLCGPGNNGGDGLVIARTLVNRGYEARVIFVGARSGLEEASPDVRTNVALWSGLGRTVEVLAPGEELSSLARGLEQAPLVVDALFGTGLTRELADPWASAVRAVGAAARPVLAVDVPSGLDANTGEILGVAIEATVTVSFIARKPGFLRGAGPGLCGRVVVAEIGVPRAFVEEALSSQG